MQKFMSLPFIERISNKGRRIPSAFPGPACRNAFCAKRCLEFWISEDRSQRYFWLDPATDIFAIPVFIYTPTCSYYKAIRSARDFQSEHKKDAFIGTWGEHRIRRGIQPLILTCLFSYSFNAFFIMACEWDLPRIKISIKT